MTSAAEYRAKAAKMHELAAETADPELAAIYVDLAKDYEAVAKDYEAVATRLEGSSAWRAPARGQPPAAAKRNMG